VTFNYLGRFLYNHTEFGAHRTSYTDSTEFSVLTGNKAAEWSWTLQFRS